MHRQISEGKERAVQCFMVKGREEKKGRMGQEKEKSTKGF